MNISSEKFWHYSYSEWFKFVIVFFKSCTFRQRFYILIIKKIPVALFLDN